MVNKKKKRAKVSRKRAVRRRKKLLTQEHPLSIAATKRRNLHSGDRPALSPLPQEIMMRKAEALGVAVWCDIKTRKVKMAADPARAADALGILLNKGQIKAKHHRAGRNFARLQKSTFGGATSKVAAYSQMVHETYGAGDDDRVLFTDDERDYLARVSYREYQTCLDILKKEGPAVHSVTWAVCIVGNVPQSEKEIRFLIRGLDALDAFFRALHDADDV